MKFLNIGGKEIVIVIPFFGKPPEIPNFEKITNTDIESIYKHFDAITKIIEEGQKRGAPLRMSALIKNLRDLSSYMLDTEDESLRAFGSQLKLTALCPEVSRTYLDEENGKTLFILSKKIINESIIRNERLPSGDFPRGFYLNVQLFYKWMDSVTDAPIKIINRIEVAKDFIDVGNQLMDAPNVHTIFKLFSDYNNKRLKGDMFAPEINFTVQYLNRIFIEMLYESGHLITKDGYEDFCRFIGEKCFSIGKSLKSRNRMLILKNLVDLYKYSESMVERDSNSRRKSPHWLQTSRSSILSRKKLFKNR